MRKFLVACLLLGLALFAVPAMGQEAGETGDKTAATPAPEKKEPQEKQKKPAISNLPLNFYGRNGLLFTSSTHVLDFKDVEPALGYMYENSEKPKYVTQTWALNVALGLPGHVELFAHVPYIVTNLQYGERFNELLVRVRSFSQKQQSGLGSIEGGFQWAFFMQDRFLPGMAVGLSYLAPTGDYTQHMSEVKYFGGKINLAMSLEIIDLFFTEYAFAIFADGSLVLNDVGIKNRQYEEKHGLVRAGILLPLHPRNFINLILEYDGKLMLGTANDNDINGVVGGLRFITNQIGVTAGAEYLFKEAEDMDNAWRFTGVGSFRFW